MEDVSSASDEAQKLQPDSAPVAVTRNVEGPDVRPDDQQHDQQHELPPVVSAADKLRDLTDTVLQFLSNASNETLAACAAGLCASTYLVLGRVGLVIIGAVGGIVLHATWEASNTADTTGQGGAGEGKRRRAQLGIEVAQRVLEWRNTNKKDTDGSDLASGNTEASSKSKPLDYSDFRPATRGALVALTDSVIRDYVKWWYTPILPSEDSFPWSCRQTLTSFIRSLSIHLARKRPADPFLDFLANSASIVIVFLNELSNAIQASQRQAPEEAVRTYLTHQPDSNLANVLSVSQQEKKLSLVADDILQSFLDPKAYNCQPVKTFLREILSGLVLEMTVKSCSKPEWINGWIVYLLEDGEPELMNVIDASVERTMEKSNAGATTRAEENSSHKRRVSRAEEAMEDAMLEAKRMNEMIREEDARKQRESAIVENEDAFSTVTTDGMATPTSSDSERHGEGDRSAEFSGVLERPGNASPNPPTTPSKATVFTDFDQIQSAYSSSQVLETPAILQLTLHNATVTVLDDGDPNDRSVLKQRPVAEYLLQIEPALSRFPGWMIARKYEDFEKLQETLRRIAVISGVPDFANAYTALPSWRGQSPARLRQELELYLRYAVRYEPLAESDAMKRFLEKETGLKKAPSNRNVLGFQNPALEAVGKGFINVLGSAPKGIAGGGKAVLGGVQGVFGTVATGITGPKRPALGTMKSAKSASVTSLPRVDASGTRFSQDVSRSGSSIDNDRPPPLPSRSVRLTPDNYQSNSPSHDGNGVPDESMHLPPPPSDMPDDYKFVQSPPRPEPPARTAESRPATPTKSPVKRKPLGEEDDVPISSKATGAPLTEEETRVSIELMFAIITELYSLSSAWTIRLSLLVAAKSFLLRPNNPQLESIRSLLQDSVIDANFSDKGLAMHISKVRENALPTEEELKKWPAELSPAEKENLQTKARKLLVERGMPQALTSVMGSAASGEALGRVHDCLMMPEVARGLIFALLLQALRAATQ